VSRERETHAAFVTLVTNAISVCQVSHTAPDSAGNCYTENSVKSSRNFLCDKSNSVCDVQRRPRDGEACSFCACGQHKEVPMDTQDAWAFVIAALVAVSALANWGTW
jgi:uncharacterized paraquat-inducible protein A